MNDSSMMIGDESSLDMSKLEESKRLDDDTLISQK